jgi:anthranilate/para-aminobenzoate synthase component I
VVRRGELVLGTGGGIVADSRADDELAETRVKAEAFLRALA